jgi:hypothetical protein
MKKNITNLYTTWEKIPKPNNKGSLEVFQYKNTNIWFLKNHLGCFGFLLSDTISHLDSEYKNITSDWKPNLKNNKGGFLNRCLIIESKSNIDSKLFCSTIETLIERNDINKLYKVNEIQSILSKIEEITLREADEFNEVVGVWGELYLLKELIFTSSDEEFKRIIIESWEGVNSRSRIDFNFKSKLINIEVKTTTELSRTHHFHSLQQLFTQVGYRGYLASFCILPDDNGLTCDDLLMAIKSNLPNKFYPNLENKINIRGKVCNNKKYPFIINSTKDLEFYKFNNVPTPISVNGIEKIEWQSSLENKAPISQKEKYDLLRLSI